MDLESLEQEGDMSGALEVLYERSNGGRTALTWNDVQDALSSGAWGRLIQTGVLEEREEGFSLTDPDDVAEAIGRSPTEAATDGEDEEEEGEGVVVFDEIDPTSWTRYDQLAGLTALLFFVGYWNPGIRNVIASVDAVVLTPITSTMPLYMVILVLAVLTGLYSTVLQSELQDTETVQAYSNRMERIKERKEAAEARGDEAAVERWEEAQMEAAKDQMGLFKLQFRPMVWIMLLTIPVFLWLRWKIRGGHLPDSASVVLPLAGEIGWTQGLLGPMPTWIVWYFICSMVARQLFRKLLHIRTQPTD